MQKRVLTTGQVARYCGVNFRTVIRWIERGDLKAFKLPGRGDNRVKLGDFIEFLRKHDMPVPPEFLVDARRVLVVQEDASTIEQLIAQLRKAGFEAVPAATSFRAGAMLGHQSPGIMMLDMEMTGLGGLDAVKALREQSRYADVKVLILTSNSPDELNNARLAGADDVLAKPFETDELIRRLQALAGE